MSSTSLELSLSLKPSYVPKTIKNLLNDLSEIYDVSDKLSVLNDYLLKHEEELIRVEAFKRELPQCMLLLMDAIETLKLEIMNIKNPKEPEESGQPLMEFLSMKRKYYEDEEGILSDYSSGKEKDLMSISADYDKKQKGILETTQPCRWGNQEVPLMSPIGSSRFPESAEREKSKEVSEGSTGTESPGAEGMVGLGGLNLKTDPVTLNYHPKQLTQPIWKNNRRSWSPELHERFVEALNILGGVEVATPKQIKEVMQVEGLTNDQVKSHLQKYRLHIKIPEAPLDPTHFIRNFKDFEEPWMCYRVLSQALHRLPASRRATPRSNLP
ncbi:hypothetical protein Pint_18928 [Pistacia integerrima]|uniref:Uncharacterized protein n=1 Tax=Pistacia integerrima TaxID=434235 RepID=A0ACC0Z1K1_9ROSI|nr:hypothetical protein Pint_18928 [Pistacia integerrima]